jgi:hypothetical protein
LAAIVAWTACALTIAIRVVVVWVTIRAGGDHLPIGYGVWIETVITGGIFGTAASIVGAVIVGRQPRNAFGWVLVIGGVVQAVVAASLYIPAVVLAHGSSDVAVFFAWLAGPLLQAAIIGLPAVGFLLFPDGRPPSGRWRAVVALATAGMVTRFLAVGFIPPFLFALPTVPNPYQLQGPAAAALVAVPGIGLLVGVMAVILGAVALVRRYSGADPTLRSQLLWFTWAGLVVAALSVPLVIVSFIVAPGDARSGAWASLFFPALCLLPIAPGSPSSAIAVRDRPDREPTSSTAVPRPCWPASDYRAEWSAPPLADLVLSAGDWAPSRLVVSVPIGPEDRPIGRLALAGRSNGAPYGERELGALRAASEVLGETLSGVGSLPVPPKTGSNAAIPAPRYPQTPIAGG